MQMVHRRLILILHGAEHRNQPAAVVGQLRSSPAFAANVALDNRKVGQVIEIVERVPGGLVRHRNALSSLGNRAKLVDGFEQADTGAPEESAGLRLDLEVSL